jgi:hypothetical protein
MEVGTMKLDAYTDHETLEARGVTITRGDIVTVGSSTIQRRVMSITDNHGARLIRIDGGGAAFSVWTKQYGRLKIVSEARA